MSSPISSTAPIGASEAVRRLTRWHAAGTHLLISCAVAAAVLALMLFVWYPGPLFQAMGGNDLALILIGVDVVMGPLLTLVVFKAGKRSLKFDLSVIGALQLAALLYGCHVVFLARPAYIVFVKDRFEVASAVELEPERLAEARYQQFKHLPWGRPTFVVGEWPEAPAERQKLVDLALAGQDLQHFPKYYAPYAERTATVLGRAQPMAHLRRDDAVAAKIVDEWLAGSRLRENDVRYVALRARHAWIGVLIDSQTAQPVKMLIVEKI